jgi:hypothetical protein
MVGGALPLGTEDPGGMLEPGAGTAAGLLRPSAPAISLTAQLHASGLNGVLAANVHALRNAVPQVTGHARLRRRDQDADLARSVGQQVLQKVRHHLRTRQGGDPVYRVGNDGAECILRLIAFVPLGTDHSDPQRVRTTPASL